jgi:hypothetical protein
MSNAGTRRFKRAAPIRASFSQTRNARAGHPKDRIGQVRRGDEFFGLFIGFEGRDFLLHSFLSPFGACTAR